jgi:hypothetical protein
MMMPNMMDPNMMNPDMANQPTDQGIPMDNQNEEQDSTAIPGDTELQSYDKLSKEELQSYLEKLESYVVELDELDKQVDDA